MDLSTAPAANSSVGRRHASRLRARLRARLVTLSGTYGAVLVDLSLTGARLQAPVEARVGQMASLTWEGFEAFGTIVWVKAGFCALHFDDPIETAVLMATRDCAQLPSDHELDRHSAREWVQGKQRV